MALTKMFKKSDAPDELPDLAIDELKKDLKKDYSEKPQESGATQEAVETKQETEKTEEKEEVPKKEQETPEESQEENTEEGTTEQETDNESDKQEEIERTEIEEVEEKPKETIEEKVNLEKSFFNPLINELKKDDFDPAKINAWYQKRFSDKSVIEEMKEYWETQKNEFITETVEKEFKARIKERMNKLQQLETEWQEIYIKLAEKEEEMKKEEKNVKKIIKDFSAIVGKKGNLKKAHKSKISNEKKKKS